MAKELLLRPELPPSATLGQSSLTLHAMGVSPVILGIARLLLFLSAFWLIAMAVASPVQAAKVFIPMIQQGSSGVDGSEGQQACILTETEQELAAILASHPNQNRDEMICDPILLRVARERGADMANRNYFGHVNPDGFGPNYLVRQAGYNLPAIYGADRRANMVESIAAGRGLLTGSETSALWLTSQVHRDHLMGNNWFTAEQTHYGIAHVIVEGSTYVNYWVFISAHPQE